MVELKGAKENIWMCVYMSKMCKIKPWDNLSPKTSEAPENWWHVGGGRGGEEGDRKRCLELPLCQGWHLQYWFVINGLSRAPPATWNLGGGAPMYRNGAAAQIQRSSCRERKTPCMTFVLEREQELDFSCKSKEMRWRGLLLFNTQQQVWV